MYFLPRVFKCVFAKGIQMYFFQGNSSVFFPKVFFARGIQVYFLPRIFKCIEGLVSEGEKGCNCSPASSTLDNFLLHAPTKLFRRKDFSVIIFDGFSLVLGGCFFFIYFSPASSLTCFQEEE